MLFNQGHALVIGIGTYDKTPRMNVPITAQDAESVAGILRDPAYCGYPENQVKLLHDAKATREGILAELDALATCTNADSTVFVFYAGHGEYGADGHFFLTTHDTVLDAQGKVTGDSGISEQELLTRIGAIPAKRAFLFFNACHSGDISPGMLGGAEEEPLHSGASLPDQLASALLGTGEGRVIITACRQDEKSYFLRGAARTIFGSALAEGLQGKDIVSRKGYISLFDLYECVYTFVSQRVHELWQQAQQPELTISKGVGVMAVALYHGTAATTGLTDADVPGSLGSVGAVREVETSESKSLLEAILEGKLKLGEQKTVNTGGGAHIEGSGHHIGIAGGNFNGPTIGTAHGPVTMGNSETVQGDSIKDISNRKGIAVGQNASALAADTIIIVKKIDNITQNLAAAPYRDAGTITDLQNLVNELRKMQQQVLTSTEVDNAVFRKLFGLSVREDRTAAVLSTFPVTDLKTELKAIANDMPYKSLEQAEHHIVGLKDIGSQGTAPADLADYTALLSDCRARMEQIQSRMGAVLKVDLGRNDRPIATQKIIDDVKRPMLAQVDVTAYLEIRDIFAEAGFIPPDILWDSMVLKQVFNDSAELHDCKLLIAIGLFSNSLTLNAPKLVQDRYKKRLCFEFTSSDDPRQNQIMFTDRKGVPPHPYPPPPDSMKSQAEEESVDYALFTRFQFSANQDLMIIGGISAEGTHKIGQYIHKQKTMIYERFLKSEKDRDREFAMIFKVPIDDHEDIQFEKVKVGRSIYLCD
ncbi:caspase family protein [Candidatus Chloroploca sp. M-50]|uniref:Caspase family protein n=1 Tax=Candidatus Chloroploca mongolica TaxID=2528176 RepID=A0ABS4DF58_9CHLR|nr:caspase family protein [Candidatus Chloroploca mongolica]MBP1468084.1 caspase family protein [Candidatus Chloroploca mongolica]